ncbi:MAG: Matrixin [Pseudomonadota bacterium]
MTSLRHVIFLFCLLLLPVQASAYVFLNASKPRMVPEDGRTQYFFLTASSPSFQDRLTFEEGTYANNTDDETFALLVERAMQAWNDIPGLGIRLKVATEKTGSIDPEDNRFSIGISKISSVASGLAYPVTKEADKSKIADCDIEVGTDIDSIPSFVFVMIHELGHCLGLGHNHSDPSAIMGYWQPRTQVVLGLDDMAGVLSLYPPRAGEKTTAFAPCGVVSFRSAKKKAPEGARWSDSDASFGMNGLLCGIGLALPLLLAFVPSLRPSSSRHRRPASGP